MTVSKSKSITAVAPAVTVIRNRRTLLPPSAITMIRTQLIYYSSLRFKPTHNLLHTALQSLKLRRDPINSGLHTILCFLFILLIHI